MARKGERDEESRADSALLIYIRVPIPFSAFDSGPVSHIILLIRSISFRNTSKDERAKGILIRCLLYPPTSTRFACISSLSFHSFTELESEHPEEVVSSTRSFFGKSNVIAT